MFDRKEIRHRQRRLTTRVVAAIWGIGPHPESSCLDGPRSGFHDSGNGQAAAGLTGLETMIWPVDTHGGGRNSQKVTDGGRFIRRRACFHRFCASAREGVWRVLRGYLETTSLQAAYGRPVLAGFRPFPGSNYDNS